MDNHALERAIARTGVERYRYLVNEHPDPQTRAEYQRLVTEIASGTYEGQRVETPASDELGGCGGCPGDPYG